MLLNRFFRVFCLQRTRKYVHLQCVFHSIRFKVNKRLEFSGTPFFMPVRQHPLIFPFLSPSGRPFPPAVTPKKNVLTFWFKRKDISSKAQGRLNPNAKAFSHGCQRPSKVFLFLQHTADEPVASQHLQQHAGNADTEILQGSEQAAGEHPLAQRTCHPVSYTHLTLPTILRV